MELILIVVGMALLVAIGWLISVGYRQQKRTERTQGRPKQNL